MCISINDGVCWYACSNSVSEKAAKIFITNPLSLAGVVYDCAFSDIGKMIERNCRVLQVMRDIGGMQGGVPGGDPEQTKQMADYMMAMFQHMRNAGRTSEEAMCPEGGEAARSAEDDMTDLQALSLDAPLQQDSEPESAENAVL